MGWGREPGGRAWGQPLEAGTWGKDRRRDRKFGKFVMWNLSALLVKPLGKQAFGVGRVGSQICVFFVHQLR